ncbi:nascent polypeptide-associated complex subunit alpha, muscle-specific form-like [Eucalyptus grandis]|uniref:nascent polypeptide-associated complex subunit alpha, muscle-specific form-like n=1 Tax=Eucalyptus grandis TaxID=71139 RepID=UPI00192F08A6|nr:nascent polypeptide-associated complex subunit alpha, muscle-specific form-like [Eucalyptus grandis]
MVHPLGHQQISKATRRDHQNHLGLNRSQSREWKNPYLMKDFPLVLVVALGAIKRRWDRRPRSTEAFTACMEEEGVGAGGPRGPAAWLSPTLSPCLLPQPDKQHAPEKRTRATPEQNGGTIAHVEQGGGRHQIRTCGEQQASDGTLVWLSKAARCYCPTPLLTHAAATRDPAAARRSPSSRQRPTPTAAATTQTLTTAAVALHDASAAAAFPSPTLPLAVCGTSAAAVRLPPRLCLPSSRSEPDAAAPLQPATAPSPSLYRVSAHHRASPRPATRPLQPTRHRPPSGAPPPPCRSRPRRAAPSPRRAFSTSRYLQPSDERLRAPTPPAARSNQPVAAASVFRSSAGRRAAPPCQPAPPTPQTPLRPLAEAVAGPPVNAFAARRVEFPLGTIDPPCGLMVDSDLLDPGTPEYSVEYSNG